MAIAPGLPIIAPWREWSISSREDALAYAERHGIPVHQTSGDLYSRDGNLWHLSHEGGILEDPAEAPPDDLYRMSANASARPFYPEEVTIGFEHGVPVALDGVRPGPVALVQELNARAGVHGIGRIDIVESRLVGMKSRGVYETPGGTVLHEALDDLCRLTLPHDLFRMRSELALRMADLVYNGQWFSPLRRALSAFADQALDVATGEVTIEMYQGHARAVSRRSPHSLYRTDLGSFDMTGYDPRQAEGFIRLFGLPLAVAARAQANAAGLGTDAAGANGRHPARANGGIDYASILVPGEVDGVR
jgi:argininosuccinate synthase